MSTWYEKAVFYHMYPLGMTGAPAVNFSPADTEVPASHRFQELSAWIPHIKKLNISAVYIGPLFESTSHGYDTRDFYRIDRRLGTNEDFRQFTALCHENGIRVVIDSVFNHTGREFFAFQDLLRNGSSSPFRNWYRNVRFDCHNSMGDPFCYDCWHGITELPCLNLNEPEVRRYLLDTVSFWTNTFDIDGLRLDCANVLDFSFMAELRKLADEIKPDFWLMGEVIHGDYSRWVNREMLHSVTNYEMHKSIYSAHNDHNYFELAHNVRRLEVVGRSLYTFVDNHDENRIASKLNFKEHLFPVYALLYTLPGIPSVYYGSEWGIEGLRDSCSDSALRPAIPADGLESRENALTRLIRTLGRIHAENGALHTGLYKELLLTNRQYAFARLGEGHAIITAANNDSEPAAVQVPLPVSTTQTECRDLLSDKIFNIENGKIQISLEGNRAVILRITEG